MVTTETGISGELAGKGRKKSTVEERKMKKKVKKIRLLKYNSPPTLMRTEIEVELCWMGDAHIHRGPGRNVPACA